MLQDYKGAIALNNMGVALLERRSFREAIETFRDAIGVMKFALDQKKLQENAGVVIQCADSNIESKLHQATQRLFLSSRQQSRPSPFFEIVSLDDGDLVRMKAAVQDGPKPSMVFPVRIGCNSCEISEDRDVDAAIILHNFGIARMCASRLSIKESAQEKLLLGSLKLFQMNQTFMANRGDRTDDVYQRIRCMLLSALVLMSAVQALILMGRNQQAFAVQSKLHHLGEALHKVHSSFSVIMGKTQTTAAAA